MHRPEHLRKSRELNDVPRFLPGMFGGETSMPRGVPILCRNDQAEEFFAACGPDVAASGALPFQCRAPSRALRFEDFR